METANLATASFRKEPAMAGDGGDTLEDTLHSLKGRNSRHLQALRSLYEDYYSPGGDTLETLHYTRDFCRHGGESSYPVPNKSREKMTAWAESLPDPQEDMECYKQFRAQPVPAHVLLPLYNDLMEQEEERHQSHVQRRRDQLIAMQKPFRFLSDERWKSCERPETPPVQKSPSVIKPIPRSVLDPTVTDRLREAELLRKINGQMRAQELLRSSSAPIPLTRNPHSRTGQKTAQQRLAFLQQNLTFQPRTNPAVPDFQMLYRNFQKLSLERHRVPEPTQTKPFKLRTSRLPDRPRPRRAESEWDEVCHSVTFSRHLSSLSPNTLPVYITDSTKMREAAIRSSLQDRDSKESRKERWLQRQQQKSLAMQRSVSQKARALDPHTPLTEANRKNLRDHRESNRRRTLEYKEELEQMKSRVRRRAYLFEQVSKGSVVKEVERRFTRTLQQAGLTEEFVHRKGNAYEDMAGGDVSDEDAADEDVAGGNEDADERLHR